MLVSQAVAYPDRTVADPAKAVTDPAKAVADPNRAVADSANAVADSAWAVDIVRRVTLFILMYCYYILKGNIYSVYDYNYYCGKPD